MFNKRQPRIELRDCFQQNRFGISVSSFHNPIKRNNLKLFAITGRIVKMKIGRDTSNLRINQNIMPKIIFWSVKSGKAVAINGALRYLLCPVLSDFPDGSKQSTAKSKLLKSV